MNKTSIIGCGHMDHGHVLYVLKIKDVELTAVCDQNEIRAKEFSKRYSIPYYI